MNNDLSRIDEQRAIPRSVWFDFPYFIRVNRSTPQPTDNSTEMDFGFRFWIERFKTVLSKMLRDERERRQWTVSSLNGYTWRDRFLSKCFVSCPPIRLAELGRLEPPNSLRDYLSFVNYISFQRSQVTFFTPNLGTAAIITALTKMTPTVSPLSA